MRHKKVWLVAMLAAAGFAAQSAQAVSNWVGTADYTAAPGATGDEQTVGNFDTYDFAPGVVLLEQTSASTFDGWYQSYVTSHQLLSNPVAATGLNTAYELTVTAWFTENLNQDGQTFSLTGGGVKLWFDTTPDKNYSGDTGFDNGATILEGTIIDGSGALLSVGGRGVGFTDLTVRVDSFDSAVFEPDTIAAGSSIFTLRLNDPADAAFLSPIGSVLGNPYDGTDIKLAADGYLVLQVPEAKTYVMMLAGLMLVGFMARRSTGVNV